MLAAINGAKRRIAFETYIYEKGSVGEQFTAALEAAARRGVQVNMVIDAMGSSVPEEWSDRLRAAGAKVGTFGKPNWYALEELNYRTHRKILVADGSIGFTGGRRRRSLARNAFKDTAIRCPHRRPIVRLMEGRSARASSVGGASRRPSTGDSCRRPRRTQRCAAQLALRRRQRRAAPVDRRPPAR